MNLPERFEMTVSINFAYMIFGFDKNETNTARLYFFGLLIQVQKIFPIISSIKEYLSSQKINKVYRAFHFDEGKLMIKSRFLKCIVLFQLDCTKKGLFHVLLNQRSNIFFVLLSQHFFVSIQ